MPAHCRKDYLHLARGAELLGRGLLALRAMGEANHKEIYRKKLLVRLGKKLKRQTDKQKRLLKRGPRKGSLKESVPGTLKR